MLEKRKELVLLEIKEMLEKSKELASNEGRKALYEKYKRTKPYSESHRYVVGVAVKWCRLICDYGGTDEEVGIALRYFLVCVDSEKYNLDYKRYRDDIGLMPIVRKYSIAKRENSK